MPRLPVLPARKVLRALRRAGFEIVSQRSSHIKLKRVHESGTRIVIVPNYSEIPLGVLVSILHQAGLSREQFLALV